MRGRDPRRRLVTRTWPGIRSTAGSVSRARSGGEHVRQPAVAVVGGPQPAGSAGRAPGPALARRQAQRAELVGAHQPFFGRRDVVQRQDALRLGDEVRACGDRLSGDLALAQDAPQRPPADPGHDEPVDEPAGEPGRAPGGEAGDARPTGTPEGDQSDVLTRPRPESPDIHTVPHVEIRSVGEWFDSEGARTYCHPGRVRPAVENPARPLARRPRHGFPFPDRLRPVDPHAPSPPGDGARTATRSSARNRAACCTPPPVRAAPNSSPHPSFRFGSRRWSSTTGPSPAPNHTVMSMSPRA